MRRFVYSWYNCWRMEKRGRKATPPHIRFWKHVKKTKGCWLWTGCVGKVRPYGLFYANGNVAAHRYSFELAHGRKAKAFVLHHCDVKLCVRPEHLYDGDTRDNTRDVFRLGRHKNQKLSPDDVQTIRELIAREYTNREIADEYGVHISAIAQLKRGETYAWLQ